MNRRDFLKVAGMTAAIPLCGASLAAEQGAPNLLVIHTDEHNFRTLGCYRSLMSSEQALMWGQAVVETPNIDWLAGNGAICTSFYATTPVCSPSRAAFVSGRYPQNTRVVTNDIPMDDGIITFAEILRRNGYSTGYAGKWHLDGTGRPQWAPQRKFGFADNRYMFNRGHWKQLEDTASGPRVKAQSANGTPTYAVEGADKESFTTDFLADKTVEFVKSNAGKPFCFMLSIPDPHGPDTVRAPYDTMFAGQDYNIPRTFEMPSEGLPGWAAPNGQFLNMAKYYGMVKCIDDNVGKILDMLREKKLMDKTVVVFTSDHGDLRGEHHRQNKGVPFEASAKVPFIVYYPARIRAGTVINEALGCVDFLPTIINLMGFKTLGTQEGRDASELLTTRKAPSGWTDITFFRGTGNGKGVNGWVAAVTDRCKLIYSPVDDPWLFDLEKDPDEMINQFANPEYRAAVRTLSRRLLEYGKKYNDPCILAEKIAADLKWATGDEAAYKPSQTKESGAGTTPAKPQKKAAASKRKQNQARISQEAGDE